MLKKVIAMLLVCSFLLCFGCTLKSQEKPDRKLTLDANNRIALIIDSEEYDPEIFAKARELKVTYGEGVIVHGITDECRTNTVKLFELALKICADESVRAIVFGRGISGTAQTVEKIREMYSDMCIVVCNTVESFDNLSGADLVLNIDTKSAATSMIDCAKSAGAELFNVYTFNRYDGYYAYSTFRNELETAGKESGLEVKISSSVDVVDEGRSIETANTYIYEDVSRKLQKNGKNVAMFSMDTLVQDRLAKEALAVGMILPSTSEMSPFALARALDINLTGHETDCTYCVEQLRAKIAESDASGRVFSWSFSEPMVALEAGLEFARSFCGVGEGESVDKTIEINSIFETLIGETAYELKSYEQTDKSIINTYLISSELYGY